MCFSGGIDYNVRTMAPEDPTCACGQILGLMTHEGLVWAGQDVLTISWDVKTVPIDQHGSTAAVHGYSLHMKDGSTRFIPGHKVLRIFRADSVNSGTQGASQ